MSLRRCPECGGLVSSDLKKCIHCGKELPAEGSIVSGLIGLGIIIWMAHSCVTNSNKNTAIATSSNNKIITTQQENIVYEKVSFDDMQRLLEQNPARANQIYNGKYIEFTGNLYHIDSNGKYFTVIFNRDKLFGSDSIFCSIKTDAQKQFITRKNTGDPIRVKGRVKRVGEIMGYRIDVVEVGEVQ